MPDQEPHYLEQSDPDHYDDRPSKSEVKRQLHAILDLTKIIVELPREKVKKLPLDDETKEAIFTAQKIKAHGARKRQIQFAGKLMREADITAIEAQIETWEKGSKEDTQQMHRLEMIRDQLINKDEALTELIDLHPTIDVQKMRTLIRNARKERDQNQKLLEEQKAPQKKHYRELYQYLKEFIIKE